MQRQRSVLRALDGRTHFSTWLNTELLSYPLLERAGLNLTQVQGWPLLAAGLLLGLSAGLFEEITRYFGYRYWIKKERDWQSALMFGAGHGGVEAILLGLAVALTFIQMMTLRGQDLAAVIPADQIDLARRQIAAYWATPWPAALLGAAERAIAIVFHISATVLVLESFRRKNLIWVLYAILWHTALDAAAVFASQTWNAYLTESILAGFALVSLAIIFGLRSVAETNNPESVSMAQPLPEIGPVNPTEENLEDSRYV